MRPGNQRGRIVRGISVISVIGVSLAVSACSESDESDVAIVTGVPVTDAGESRPATTAVTSVTSVPETSAGSGRDFGAIAPVVGGFVDDHGLNGAGLVVVDRDDGVVHEEYWGEFDAGRVSLIASSTKMITAGVLMRLAEDGLLDVDAPVAEAVDWGSGNPDITPAQLVSNSSGLVGLGPAPTYGPYLCQFTPDAEIEACAETVFTTTDDDPDVIPPDTEFRYGGAQWQVAGAVAEAVSGKPWAQLIDEIYVQPCGVATLGYNNHWIEAGGFDYPAELDPLSQTPTQNPHMEGGAYISAPDYAELLLMHLRGGQCPHGRVMAPESIDRLHQDRTLTAYSDGASAPGYGMGWWVDRATGRISDDGAYGSVPWLDLDAGYGAYLVIEGTNALGRDLAGMIEPLIDDAMAG